MSVVHKLRHSQFLLHNTVFFFGSVAVGALNYLYYPVLGRSLPPGEFGEVQTLVSLFLQLCVFLVVLSTVIVNIVANGTDPNKRNGLVFEFEKLALVVSLILLAASVVFRTQLQGWLQFASPWPFVLLGAAVVACVPFTLRGAYLRGQQKFGLVSAGNITLAGGKLLISAALVLLGLGTIGAIWGVLIAQIVACGLVVWWARKRGLHKATGKKSALPNMRLLAPELRFGGVVLVASLAVTLQYSIDIIVVKHYFDAHTAGLYAGVSAVARIMFFLTASVSQVLLSKVRLADIAAENRRTLRKSLALLCGVSVPILVIFIGFPTQVVGLLMGSAYHNFAVLLPKLSLSVFIASILNLLAAYYLALRHQGIAIVLAGGAGLTYLLILLHHGTPAAVVNSLLWGSAGTLTIVGAWKLKERGYGYGSENNIDHSTRL